MYIYIYACTYEYLHICIYMYIEHIHIYIYTYVVHLYLYNFYIHMYPTFFKYVCVYTHLSTLLHICTYIYCMHNVYIISNCTATRSSLLHPGEVLRQANEDILVLCGRQCRRIGLSHSDVSFDLM